MSFPTSVPSIAKDTAVPAPGTHDAAPEAISRPAPNTSPWESLQSPNPTPIAAPTKGTAFAATLLLPLAAPPFNPDIAAIFAAAFAASFAATFLAAFSANSSVMTFAMVLINTFPVEADNFAIRFRAIVLSSSSS